MRLRDMVAIITGGAHGIGIAYAEALSMEGAKVVIADLDAPAAQDFQKQLEASGRVALASFVDVSNEKSIEEMVKKTVENFGRIDILVNNAAIYAELKRKAWNEISMEEWQKVMDVNVMGCYLCAKAVFLHMKAQGEERS